MEQQKKDMKMPVHIQPVFADEANVNANVKVNLEKTEDGEDQVRKIGKIDVLFFDQFARSIVSRVVIDPFTAKSLGRLLINNADRLMQEMENNEIPEEVKEQIKNRQEKTEDNSFNTYIG